MPEQTFVSTQQNQYDINQPASAADLGVVAFAAEATFAKANTTLVNDLAALNSLTALAVKAEELVILPPYFRTRPIRS